MLYIVATPIGNMSEITFRAVEVLKEVDFIAAEDTRHSKILLKRYEIDKPMISYQKFNERVVSKDIIRLLQEGKNIALISDAGMPLISDPGSILVEELIANNLEYTVVSGACAAINALVLSGIGSEHFCMVGFLPPKNIDRDRLMDKFEHLEATLVFYCAPHDLVKDMEYLSSKLGARKAAIVREISKMYEQTVHINLGESLDDVTLKGEFVVVVEGAKPQSSQFNSLSVVDHVQHYLDEGLSTMDAAKKAARDRGMAKSVVYNQFIKRQ